MAEENEIRTCDNERLLTPGEAAEYLQVSREQVRKLIRKGQIVASNVGAGSKRPLYRITQQALDDFLNHGWRPSHTMLRKKFKRPPPVPDFFPHLK